MYTTNSGTAPANWFSGGGKGKFFPNRISGLSTWLDASTRSTYTDGAVQFTASDKAYLSIASNSSLQMGDNDFEFACWVKIASTSGLFGIMGKYSGGTGNDMEYLIYNNYGTIKFAASNNGTGADTLDSTVSITAGNWYFIRAWYVKANSKMYLSVNNQATPDNKAHTGGAYAGTAALNFGGYFFDGAMSAYSSDAIDSSYVTKTVSTVAQATALYNAGAGQTWATAQAAAALSGWTPISWWDMNEEDGTRYDAVSTNHLAQTFANIIDATTLNGGFETIGTNGGLSTNVATATVARATNVVTIVTAAAHGLTSTNVVTVTGLTDATLNAANVAVTVVNATTFFYTKAGSDVTVGADTGGRVATDVFANWTETTAGLSTINADTAAPYAGTYACRMDIDSSGNVGQISTAALMTVGKKYKYSFYAKGASGTPSITAGDSNAGGTSFNHTLTTSYVQYSGTVSVVIGGVFIIKRGSASSNSLYIDNVVLTSAEIQSAAGIASGLATDGNLCASFTKASSQKLSIASNASLQTGDIDFEVFGWVNFTDLGTGGATTSNILSKGGPSGAGTEYDLAIINGNNAILYVRDAADTANDFVQMGAVLAPDNWYFVRAWHDSVNNQLGIQVNNGTPVTKSYSAGVFSGTTAVSIGGISTSYFNERADSVGLIKRRLTTAEATALFNNGKAIKYVDYPSTMKADASLVQWNLDEYSAGTSNVTRHDSTANGNDLTSAGNTPSGQGVDYFEGTVSKQLDQSGNGNNFTQTTQSAYPMYSTNVQNGKPAIVFNGLTQTLMNAADKVGNGNITIVAVLNPRSFGGGQGRIITTNTFSVRINSGNFRLQVSDDSTATNAYSANSSITVNTNYVIIITRTSAGVTNIYLNGVLSGSADQSAGSPNSNAATYIGNNSAGTGGFDGWFYEMPLIYTGILTVAQITNLTNYFRSKWGF